jgi:hypothetical protein
MPEPRLTKARLIPVSGIGTVAEAEQRATSALLAVLSVVRDLSIELLSPLGASRAQKATVETFIEVNMPKTKVRPDGLIRVTSGSSSWSCYVEVKTGDHALTAEQINNYWDLARDTGVDHVLTISNEIATQDRVHPTDGLKVRANSKVCVSHISWSAIVSTALRLKQHKGVSDPEQAWLLDELLRYLQHRASGALDFSDMGGHWVAVRDDARKGTLTRHTEGITDVARRWEQLLRFGALQLSAEIGADVDLAYPRGQHESKARTAAMIDSLATNGVLTGALRIPNTASDLSIEADLRARQLVAAADVTAPQDKGTRGRVSWLVNQLADAPGETTIEAYAKNARAGSSASLDQTREDRNAPLGDQRREPHRFRVVMRTEMGLGRKAGTRSPGFVTTVLNLINVYYGAVLQAITPWQPPAPRILQAETSVDRRAEDGNETTPSWPTLARE